MIELLKARLAKTHKSWTMWFNSMMAIFIANLPLFQDTFPQLQPYLPANLYQAVTIVLIVGNMLLRLKTTQALEAK